MTKLPVLLSLLLAAGCNPATGDQSASKTDTARTTLPFAFDRAGYDARLATASDPRSRDAVLKERWDAICRAMGYCRSVEGPGFYRSLSTTRVGSDGSIGADQVIRGDLTEPLLVPRAGIVRIEGDCRADVRLETSAVLHVLGDLFARVSLEDGGEVVVCGNVPESGRIISDGITRAMIGGDLSGNVVSAHSLYLWVLGSMTGNLQTGTPSTTLHVLGDFRGDVKPFEEAATLSVDIHGFMSGDCVQSVVNWRYNDANFSIGASDMPARVYRGGPIGPLGEPIGFWVVHQQVSQKSSQDRDGR